MAWKAPEPFNNAADTELSGDVSLDWGLKCLRLLITRGSNEVIGPPDAWLRFSVALGT